MIAQVHTGCVDGVDALLVRVEVALTTALPAFSVVGLAQGSVREGRERVAAALRASGHPLPPRRITVNLAPADVRKVGTAFDLPIAVGILAAAGVVPPTSLEGSAFIGEVGLDGRLRRVPAVLPVALAARDAGLDRLFVPRVCAGEAGLAAGVRVEGLDDLVSVIDVLCGRLEGGNRAHFVDGARGGAEQGTGALAASRRDDPPDARDRLDLDDVVGQDAGKRALEIAAAGGHHLLMTGPPGSGKTMLARRLPGLLPPLNEDEALEVARVRSISGLPVDLGVLHERPFRAPHHSVSYAGLVGGGRPLTPGEISLAHRGVLFLDELPEFRRDAIEVLRQPLEEGHVTIARAGRSARLPCDFLLVAAMNPCPCGYLGDVANRCRCDPGAVDRYRRRVSGPLMDRIDLVVEMPAPASELLLEVSASGGEGGARTGSRRCAERVAGARARARIEPTAGDRRLTAEGRALLRRSAESGALSARGVGRVLRVSATIADLAGRSSIECEDVAEALHFRLHLPPAS